MTIQPTSIYESQSLREADLRQHREREIQQGGESVFANKGFGLVTPRTYWDWPIEADEVLQVNEGEVPLSDKTCLPGAHLLHREMLYMQIRKLSRTHGSEWKNESTFNDVDSAVAEGCGLTANITFSQLKVYY